MAATFASTPAASGRPSALPSFPRTSTLLVTMNQRDDLGAATPGDWLAEVRQGQDWRFPGCYGQGGPACAGVPDPIAVLDEHAAVGDLAILTGRLGPPRGPPPLVSEWQTAKVAASRSHPGGFDLQRLGHRRS